VNESQGINPYQPPKAVVLDPVETHELEPAGNGLRFGTYVVDTICIYILNFLFGFALYASLGDQALVFLDHFPPLLIGIVIFIFYYLLFEGLLARTPGKFLCRTIVVDEDGGPPRFRHILIRTLSRLIPFEPFSFLFAERGWHDGIAHTLVVPVRR